MPKIRITALVKLHIEKKFRVIYNESVSIFRKTINGEKKYGRT